MCELFGFTGRIHQKLNQELKEFYSHSDEHPNGWGLAILDESNFSINTSWYGDPLVRSWV